MTIHNKQGLTLIEILVVIGIFTLLTPVTLYFVISLYKNFYEVNSHNTAIINGQKTLQKIITEIRQAKQADTGAYAIITAQDGALTFYANIDNDPDTERIRYWLNGSKLIRGIIKPTPGVPPLYDSANESTSTLSSFIQNTTTPIFTYYDTNYSGSEDPLSSPVNIGDIRYIKTTILIDDNPTEPPTVTTFTSSAQIRSLKDNL